MARKFIFAAALAVLFFGGITTGAGGSPTSVSRICFTVTRTVTEAATSTVTTVSTVISTVTRTVTVTSQGTTSAATTTAPPTTTGTSPVPSGSPMFGIAAGADMQNWSAGTVGRALDDYGALHARWIRHDFAWDAIEPQRGTYTWAGFDQLVTAARSRGIDVIATITYTPAWANGGHSDHAYAPTAADEFGQFAGAVAGRYAPQGVHTYEIWNEPNIGFWKPTPDPQAYTAVLCSAYQRIHAADPAATVITGGTSPAGDGPSTYSPQTWLSDLYAAGAKPCFDAVGHHPYVDAWANWDAMATYTVNLRQIEIAHGDTAKKIWATEVGCNRSSLGDTECSNRISQAFGMWRGYTWAGALLWFTYWDPNVYGLVDGNWAPRPEWLSYQSAAAQAT